MCVERSAGFGVAFLPFLSAVGLVDMLRKRFLLTVIGWKVVELSGERLTDLSWMLSLDAIYTRIYVYK